MYHIISKATNIATGQRDILGTRANRDEARAFAKANAGTVKTDAEMEALRTEGAFGTSAPTGAADILAQADKAPAVEDKAPVTMLSLAEKIAGTPKVRKTVGLKEKVLKRPPTDADILLAAGEELKRLASCLGETTTKVTVVRGLALWNNKCLQRKDVLTLIATFPTDLGIAPATVSTQFQFARSGKTSQNG